jgi:complex III assembly factor LYRM7
MLLGARQAAREGFEKGRYLSPDSKEAADQVHHAEDVARILRENVVQGKAMDTKPDTYSMHFARQRHSSLAHV